jgi:hypothetical protein
VKPKTADNGARIGELKAQIENLVDALAAGGGLKACRAPGDLQSSRCGRMNQQNFSLLN